MYNLALVLYFFAINCFDNLILSQYSAIMNKFYIWLTDGFWILWVTLYILFAQTDNARTHMHMNNWKHLYTLDITVNHLFIS